MEVTSVLVVQLVTHSVCDVQRELSGQVPLSSLKAALTPRWRSRQTVLVWARYPQATVLAPTPASHEGFWAVLNFGGPGQG